MHLLLNKIDSVYDAKISSIKFLEVFINLEYMNKNYAVLDAIFGFNMPDHKVKCFFKIDKEWNYKKKKDITVSVKKNATIDEFVIYFKSVCNNVNEKFPLLWQKYIF